MQITYTISLPGYDYLNFIFYNSHEYVKKEMREHANEIVLGVFRELQNYNGPTLNYNFSYKILKVLCSKKSNIEVAGIVLKPLSATPCNKTSWCQLLRLAKRAGENRKFALKGFLTNNVLMSMESIYQGFYFYSTIIHAINKSDLDLAIFLLEDHSHINFLSEDPAYIDKYRQDLNLVHHAAIEDKAGFIPVLVREIFPVDSLDKFHMTPLMHACRRSSKRSINVLLECGASPFQVDKFGQSALHHLASAKFEDADRAFIERLLKKLKIIGVNIDTLDYSGYSPLVLAIASKNIVLACCLIDIGAKSNPVDIYSMNFMVPSSILDAFSLACQRSVREVVEKLIARGEEVEFVNSCNKTPLEIVCENQDDYLVRLLIRSGAKLNNVLEKFYDKINYVILRFLVEKEFIIPSQIDNPHIKQAMSWLEFNRENC